MRLLTTLINMLLCSEIVGASLGYPISKERSILMAHNEPAGNVIEKEPINQWAQRLGVTDTTGHDQLSGQTLRIHGKGAFEVDRIEGGRGIGVRSCK